MADLVQVYNDLEQTGVYVCFRKLMANKAISSADGIVCIDCSQIETTAEETTIAIHESGHFISGAFYTPYSPWQLREQAEYKANKQAILKYVPESEISLCVNSGRSELWELAEHFNITEEFMLKAILYYSEQRNSRAVG